MQARARVRRLDRFDLVDPVGSLQVFGANMVDAVAAALKAVDAHGEVVVEISQGLIA